MPPVIDREKCIGCGDCLFQCGAYVFEFDVPSCRARVMRGTDCLECFICEKTCPAGAITVYFKGLKKGVKGSG